MTDDAIAKYRPTIMIDRHEKRGWKTLIVNGEPWAEIAYVSHGPQGGKYQFFQIGGDGEAISRIVPSARGERQRVVEVWSDKIAKRGERDRTDTVTDRLATEAGKLIAEVLLTHPSVAAARLDAERQRWQQEKARSEVDIALFDARFIADAIGDASAPDQDVAEVDDLSSWLIDGKVNLIELAAAIRRHVLTNL